MYAWTNSDGSLDDRVEKLFWPTENGLKAFYKELHRGNLTQNIACTFIMFISSLAIRVPDFIEKTRVHLDTHLNFLFNVHRDELVKRCLPLGVPPEAFDYAEISPTSNAVLGTALKHIKTFTKAFIQYDWVFFRAIDGHFITSDCPVTIDGPGLLCPETMVLIPLGRRFAAIGRLGNGTSTRFDPMSADGISAFNQIVFDKAPRFIFSSQRIEHLS